MRFTTTFLVVLLTVGCGTGDPHTRFGISFSPPALLQLSPNAVPVNSTPFVMTVTGANFGADAVVYWNGLPQSTRFVSSTQLLARVTDADLTQFGLAQVFVRTGGLTSNTMDFDVTAQ
jgi:hypothetical protein